MQRRIIILGVVFITGACVLVVEVLATRVLAPYFGSTIYTVSSVIGVVLGALSVGYYVGGRIADARPSVHIFYGLIALSGISVFGIEALLLFVMPSVGYKLPLITGPLISSVALFFVPSALLGMLSPFAITLQKKEFHEIGIGTLSGEIFFWSTIGSIAGSLSAGFILIPQWGTHTILIGVGVLLCVLGVMGIVASRPPRSQMMGMIALLVMLMTIPPALWASALVAANRYVYLEDGVYERLAIYDGEYKGRPARFLLQDRSNSSAMFLDSDELAFDYTKYYTLARGVVPDLRHALVLGAGAYSVPKAILSDYPEAAVDVVDIEPELENLSKRFFNLDDDARIRTYTMDARRFLQNPPRQYDLIFSDIYSSLYSLPVHATSREFFRDLKTTLAPDGIVVINVIGSLSRTEPSLTFSLMRTMREEFSNTTFFAVRSRALLEPQNIIFVGINGTGVLDAGGYEAGRIDPERYDLSRYPVFTDVYAPVESATRNLFEQIERGNGFSEHETMALIAQQLSFGPRHVGSEGHARMQDFLQRELSVFADEVIIQRFKHEGSALANVIARFNPKSADRIILGTHYDTNPTPSTPGANNGASGVAVLLELARALADEQRPRGIDLVFFDAEEGVHGVQAADWRPIGSEYFATHLTELYPAKKPQSALVIDMVCEKDAQIRDRSPDIHDDHTALNNVGIPSTLLIDYDYPYNYSSEDTLDKCSADTLQSIGDTVYGYLGKS